MFCHSWGCHITLHETVSYANVDNILLNPAYYPTGATALEFLRDIQATAGNLWLVAGANDPLSMLGGGQYFQGYNPATAAWEAVNDDLRQVMEGRGFQQFRIPGVRHGAEDLIRAGGLDRIPPN